MDEQNQTDLPNQTQNLPGLEPPITQTPTPPPAPNKKNKWLKIIIVAVAFVGLASFIRIFLLSAFFAWQGESLNTFGGSMVLLAISFILTIIALLLAPILLVPLLRKLKLPHPFMVAASAGLTFLTGIITTDQFPRMPEQIVPFFTVGLAIVSFAIAFFLFSSGKKIWLKLAAQIAVLAILWFTIANTRVSIEENQTKQNVLNRGFDIYETTSDDIDTENIRNRSDGDVPFVHSLIDTPNGAIGVHQTKEDENIKKLLIPPDRCDYYVLSNYISLSKTDVKESAKLPCQVVYQSNDRIIMAPTKITYSGDETYDVTKDEEKAYYLAKIKDTILVFGAYPTDYYGTQEEALPYIIDFVENARVITDEELVR